MSYEGRHWGCGPEEEEKEERWRKFEQAMEIYPDSIEHHEKAATKRRDPLSR